MKKLQIYPPTPSARRDFREYIGENFPSCEITRAGASILGEDLDLFRIGQGKISVLYVGAHHGAEYITTSLLWSFILNTLSSGKSLYDIDTELYFRSFSVYVLPLLNPDGVNISLSGIGDNILADRQRAMLGEHEHKLWQANARGVDLNHNYDFGYNEYKKIELNRKISPGLSLYSGEYPESEPESAALMRLVRSLDFSLIVALHSQGEEIYYRPSGASHATRMAERLSLELGYKLAQPEGTAAYGGFSDYTGEEMGITSLTVEVGLGKNPIEESELLRINDRLNRALFKLPLYI